MSGSDKARRTRESEGLVGTVSALRETGDRALGGRVQKRICCAGDRRVVEGIKTPVGQGCSRSHNAGKRGRERPLTLKTVKAAPAGASVEIQVVDAGATVLAG